MTALATAMQQMGGALWRVDRVVLAILGILVLLALLVPAQALESVRFVINATISIAPFLVLSIVIAGGAKASGMDRQAARALSQRPVMAILAASAFGAVSPFCSCGVIPVIAALLIAGVPLAPVLAFCLSSPLMNPTMFLLSSAEFGPGFAIAQTTAAFGMGLLAGFVTHTLTNRGILTNPLRQATGGGSFCSSSAESPVERTEIVWAFWRHPERRDQFRDESWSIGLFLLKWLSLAFVIESLMVAYIPAETVGSWLGGDRWWAVPASVAAGIPAYLNGFAAVPTVSALVEMGMGPGAALAFMVAGGVTSIPAVMAVAALMRRTVVALYLALAVSGSLMIGFAYQAAAGV